MNNDNKKQLTAQEWELRRWENNNKKWARLKKCWADWKRTIQKRLKLTPY